MKEHSISKGEWRQLKESVDSLEDTDVDKALQLIEKFLISSRATKIEGFAANYPILKLLLNGESHRFAYRRSTQSIQQLKSELSHIADYSQSGLSSLEFDVGEFAITKTGEICGVCREGELGYWLEPESGEKFINCPECPWSNYDFAHEQKYVRPALTDELKEKQN